MDLVIRAVKGAGMAFMFALFFFGILIELVLALPVIAVLAAAKGPDPGRMQFVHRTLLTIWLWLMRVLRLLAGEPGVGRPVEGPAVVVANHPGLFDVLFLMRDIPQMGVLVKYSLARTLPLGPVFRSCGYVLSPDGVRISPLESLEQSIDCVKSGRKFQLFPEGTRSPVDGLRKFSAGAFRIAARAGVPVQPVLIVNDPPFMPKGAPWYLPPRPVSRLRLEYWDPMPPPAEGEEKEFAKALEERYRQALGI